MTTTTLAKLPGFGYAPLEVKQPNERVLEVSDSVLSVAVELETADALTISPLNIADLPDSVPDQHIAAILDYVFARNGKIDHLVMTADLAEKITKHLIHKVDSTTGDATCFRSGFYQDRTLWHWQKNGDLFPEVWTKNEQGTAHPLRQEQPKGTVYQRYDYQSDVVVSFRSIDPVEDLDLFHGWMNQQRVAEFWEMNQSREELSEYLHKLLKDRRTWPLIGCFNGEPFGYMEIYWAMEDRIAPFCDCKPWDRGFHLLVGSHKFLGSRYSLSWTRSITHFLLLDDPRTRTLVGEPRADNKRVLKLLSPAKWEFVKEFDFPHKRAALVNCQRQNFFEGIQL